MFSKLALSFLMIGLNKKLINTNNIKNHLKNTRTCTLNPTSTNMPKLMTQPNTSLEKTWRWGPNHWYRARLMPVCMSAHSSRWCSNLITRGLNSRSKSTSRLWLGNTLDQILGWQRNSRQHYNTQVMKWCQTCELIQQICLATIWINPREQKMVLQSPTRKKKLEESYRNSKKNVTSSLEFYPSVQRK